MRARVATLLPERQPGGDTHKYQTEGYYIISGGGTIFTDGYVLNGTYHSNRGAGGTDGPSCAGMAYNVKKVEVKAGDIIIIPAGVVHGWVDVPDHVDYFELPAVAEPLRHWLGEPGDHEVNASQAGQGD